MNRVLFVLVLLITSIAGGCSGDGDPQEAMTSASDCEEGGHYFLFRDPVWELREAVDYPPDLGPLAAVEPSLDWYSEHERFVATSEPDTVEGMSLRLSGHETALEEHAKELMGVDLAEEELDGQRAYVATGPEGAPSIVTVAAADNYTLMLLSYGLGADELIEVATRVERVCKRDWIEAGGQILDCTPTDPGCIESP